MKNQKKIINNLKIIDLGINGVGIAKNKEGKIVFIDQAVIGDIVNVLIYKTKKKYLEGKIINFLYLSPLRIKPKCEHFGLCGGCTWQHLSYEEQIIYKKNRVLDNIKRIAGIKLNFLIFPILKFDNIYFYRNKVEFSFSHRESLKYKKDYKKKIFNSNVLGFHVSKMSNNIIHINKCYLINDIANQIHFFIYHYSINNNLSFFNLKIYKGLLRHVMIRWNQKYQFMVVFQFGIFDKKIIDNLFIALTKKFTQIINIGYIINKSFDNFWNQLSIRWYQGKGFLIEKIENCIFKIYAKSFFQTNTVKAIYLYQVVRRIANLTGNELVFDFYSGIGTISQMISFQVKKVVGIESCFESVLSANESVKINNIYNCDFMCSDLKDIFSCNLITKYGYPNIIIVDPPRIGLHKKVLEFILYVLPKNVIYISCNSATQCRDLKMLKSSYQLIQLEIIDMFPQTDHIESVVLLENKHKKLL